MGVYKESIEVNIMSIRHIRRSALVLAGAGAVALGGLFAGRLAAGTAPAFGAPAFARIARALDLTDDQKAQIRTILKARATDIQDQMKAGLDARRALHEAILADPIDEAAIRARAADLSRVEANGAVLYAHIRTEVFPILTADQKQKVGEFRQRLQARGDRAAKAFQRFLNGQEP
jgi:Spy/CpxP family protein refolding chaperone